MYDVYLVSARSDVAGAITFRQGTAGATKEVKELVVPAFGTLEMTPDSAHLRLSALKKPLAEKDSVAIDITTDGNVVIEVKAVVLRGGRLFTGPPGRQTPRRSTDSGRLASRPTPAQ